MNKKVCSKCRENYFAKYPHVHYWGASCEDEWQRGVVTCPYKFEHEDEWTKQLKFSSRIYSKDAFTISTKEVPNNCRYKLEHCVLTEDELQY